MRTNASAAQSPLSAMTAETSAPIADAMLSTNALMLMPPSRKALISAANPSNAAATAGASPKASKTGSSTAAPMHAVTSMEMSTHTNILMT